MRMADERTRAIGDLGKRAMSNTGRIVNGRRASSETPSRVTWA